jgi:hypothetical protein
MRIDEVYVGGTVGPNTGPPDINAMISVYSFTDGGEPQLVRTLTDFESSASVSEIALDSSGRLYVASFAAISVFPPGGTTPIGVIKGPATKLYDIQGLVIDSEDNLYVLNLLADSVATETTNTITAYSAHSITSAKLQQSGNVTPWRVWTGLQSAGDAGFSGFDIDRADMLYVGRGTDAHDVNQTSIRVYPTDAPSGDLAPVRVISGSQTGLQGHGHMAFDSDNNLYVSNFTGSSTDAKPSILVFAPDATNTAPVRTIHGPHTELSKWEFDLAFDQDDLLYVANRGKIGGFGNLAVFAAGASGDAAPMLTIGAIVPLSGLAVGNGRARLPVQSSSEAAWTWVSYATMVDGNPHFPMGPDMVAALASGVALAVNARYSSPALRAQIMELGAKQVALAAAEIEKAILEGAGRLKR